jgi:anti-anti-sigma regulatory factor
MVIDSTVLSQGVVILTFGDDEFTDLAAPVQVHLDAGRRLFVIDLAGHDFLNSVVIAAIILAQQQVTQAGGRLQVANLGPRLRQIFALLKLQRLFALDFDRDRAIAACHA